ncbi:MAG: decarboxylating 6-phosphogluconate dehydrogenase [Bacteroidales bacterium]|nr:decarboxylating 6-phosphogluconate dehydrogenase [Bacteroidales bacterium]
MKLALIGLGKMGGNMALRLLQHNHNVVVYDRSREAIDKLVESGAEGAESLRGVVDLLPERKIVWIMVPAGKPVDDTLESLKELLSPNDIIIDGGNSNYKQTIERGKKLAENGIKYLDCGTSGGVWGLTEGYSLMSGGDKEASEYVLPIYEALAPEGGYTYCGESGSGHFTKMVHNGIEYGMMQSFAEGFEIMKNSPFNLDLQKIAEGWRYGSVVRSWLLDLLADALKEEPGLGSLKDYVEDSGEGRWTLQAAVDFDVPASTIAAALFARFQSRQDESFAMKILAALRNQFGGHAVKSK